MKAKKLPLIPIENASTLLKETKRKVRIAEASQLLGLKATDYHRYCQPLLDNLAQYCQQLPASSNTYFSQLGGLLDFALSRTTYALKALRAYFYPDDSDYQTTLTEQQSLWSYTLFTASLLHDVGQVITDFNVKLYNQEQRFLHDWIPTSGHVDPHVHFYQYEFTKEPTLAFRQQATLFMAKTMMPQEGMEWIAHHEEALPAWFALLVDDKYASGTLGPILSRAMAEAVMGNILELKQLLGSERSSSFLTSFTTPFSSTDLSDIGVNTNDLLGFEMMQWLQDQMKSTDKQLSVGGQTLIQTTEGFLLTTEMYKLFCRENNVSASWLRVKESLNNYLQQITGEPEQTFVEKTTNKTVTGTLLPVSQLHVSSDARIQIERNSSLAQINYTKVPGAAVLPVRFLTLNQATTQQSSPSGQPTQRG